MSKRSFLTTRLLVLALAAATACASERDPGHSSHVQPDTIIDHLPAQARAMLSFQDQMRKIWEDHILWTRLVIISVAHDLPDAGPTTQRLLANQVDIGNMFRPFYGDAVADRLTALFTDHILIAARILTAAKGGDSAGVDAAYADWVANADEIAGLWAEINSRAWPFELLQAHMREHLALTLDEAVLRLSGDFAGDIAKYEEVTTSILGLADLLSAGIFQQFPQQFP